MTEQHKTNGAVPWMRETDLFVGGAEGYHTFRIPSLVVATDGTILAFCEGRKFGARDYHALYIVLKRSSDSGATWAPLQVLAGDGERTYHNPTAVVDRDTGVVWLAYNIDADRTCVIRSEDDGATWSEPKDITGDVKAPHMTYYVTGPGHGIQRRDGTLVLPAGHQGSTRHDSVFSHSHVIFSRDHGATWELGGALAGGTNECEAVETADGSLYMAVRSSDSGINSRVCAWSRDGGASWSELQVLDHLPDPRCQASIVRFTGRDTHDRDRVLFSNTASNTRDSMTVRVSYDECRTWPVSKVLYPGPCAYSELAVAADMTICCLYERGVTGPYDSIRLAQFDLEWLTEGSDKLALV